MITTKISTGRKATVTPHHTPHTEGAPPLPALDHYRTEDRDDDPPFADAVRYNDFANVRIADAEQQSDARGHTEWWS